MLLKDISSLLPLRLNLICLFFCWKELTGAFINKMFSPYDLCLVIYVFVLLIRKPGTLISVPGRLMSASSANELVLSSLGPFLLNDCENGPGQRRAPPLAPEMTSSMCLQCCKFNVKAVARMCHNKKNVNEVLN